MTYIEMHIMYRDGANYKTGETVLFENKDNLPEDEIYNFIEENISTYQPIIADDYKLPNIAPYDNEFVPCGQYDHPFIEITNVAHLERVNKNEHYEESDITDIGDWIEFVKEKVTHEYLEHQKSIRRRKAIRDLSRLVHAYAQQEAEHLDK